MKEHPAQVHDPKDCVMPYITPEPKAHDIDRKLAISDQMNRLFGNFNLTQKARP